VGATVVGARAVVVGAVVGGDVGGVVPPVGIEVTGVGVVPLVGPGVVSGTGSVGMASGAPAQAAIAATNATDASRPAHRAGRPERVLRIRPQ
jgi:hypothetical protein